MCVSTFFEKFENFVVTLNLKKQRLEVSKKSGEKEVAIRVST